ncbi:MAG: hypothetical protein WCA00_01900 [Candidatus Acidiferrales bacterium]
MDLILRAVLLFVAILAGVLLFTPYEAFLEGLIALVILAAAVVGFAIHPRREVFYVRTSVRLIDADRRQAIEKDLLAVRVEVARLWLLFAPTFLAVAFLVFFATGGPTKFSFLNWIFTSRLAYLAFLVCQYPPLLVLLLLWEWIAERRVMRDAEACSARSFSIYPTRAGRFGRVSYQFMGENGEYYGGDCAYFKLIHSRELAAIVFQNVRTPELNRIAMGFLFHRLIILGRGVTDLDKQTTAAQAVLAETAPSS